MLQIYRATLYIQDGETDDGNPDWTYAGCDTRVLVSQLSADDWLKVWPDELGPGAIYRCEVEDSRHRIISTAETPTTLTLLA